MDQWQLNQTLTLEPKPLEPHPMSAEQLPSYHTKSFQAPRLNGKASAWDKVAVSCPGFTVTCATCVEAFVHYPTLMKSLKKTAATEKPSTLFTKLHAWERLEATQPGLESTRGLRVFRNFSEFNAGT